MQNAPLSYHLSLRSLFYLFLSGRLRRILLYLQGYRLPVIILTARDIGVTVINTFSLKK